MANEIHQYDANIRREMPETPWLEPMRVGRIDGSGKGLACRLCIARIGLKATDLESRTFATRSEFDQHMKDIHEL